MSGHVSFVIRDKNKNIHKMVRHTSEIESFIQNPSFFSGDNDHLQSFLEEYKNLKEDYEKHKKDKEFKFKRTPFLFPVKESFSPQEYGIVFVDYVSKQVISCQGYMNPGLVGLASIFVASRQSKIDKGWKDQLKHWEEMFQQGLLSELTTRTKDMPSLAERKIMNAKRLIPAVKAAGQDEPLFSSLIIKGSFKFHHEVDTPAGFSRSFKRVKDLVTLTSQEQKQWKKWLK